MGGTGKDVHEGLMCTGPSAHDSSSFSPLGPDPGPTDIQLRALSQESVVAVLPAGGERVCGWGRGDMELSLREGDGAKLRHTEPASGFQR